ncbi:ubiquitin-conjugating enzyme/RWD-like protein, partial [Lineolata rhizophorae]
GPSRSASPAKRLLTEIQQYQQEPSEAVVHLAPVADDDLMHWTAVLKGPSRTAYEGGLWKLDILIPPTYPFAPPDIKFVTPICHPNVHFKKSGEICLDLLKTAWTPVYTLGSTMSSIQQLLTSAEPESPLNVDIAALFRLGDLVAAEALIRYYTETQRYEY